MSCPQTAERFETSRPTHDSDSGLKPVALQGRRGDRRARAAQGLERCIPGAGGLWGELNDGLARLTGVELSLAAAAQLHEVVGVGAADGDAAEHGHVADVLDGEGYVGRSGGADHDVAEVVAGGSDLDVRAG